MRLALTDFNKNRVFYRNCMWLQLSQILKIFTEGNARNLAFVFSSDVTKNRKTRVASREGIHFGARSCDDMYCVRESRSKLGLFHRLFIELYCHIFWGTRLKHVLERSLKLLLLHSRSQRPRSSWSEPRIATSGQVQHRKSTIHGLPVTLRMFRVKFDKSDWFWSQSIVSTKPFKNGMPLD